MHGHSGGTESRRRGRAKSDGGAGQTARVEESKVNSRGESKLRERSDASDESESESPGGAKAREQRRRGRRTEGEMEGPVWRGGGGVTVAVTDAA